ncbi:MAG: hypothetical protein AB1801_17240, partial [Chloroflexota bacterium]
VALAYRLALTLFADRPGRRWLAFFTAAGLAFSFWHVVMSRTAYEATLVPPFLALTGYLFWRGWQRRSLWSFTGAGLALGLTQYTYVSGRLAPLVFGLFGLVWTLIAVKSKKIEHRSGVRCLWLGLGVMALASLILFLPLLRFILNDFESFFFRSSDVFILNRVEQGQANAAEQVVTALRVFFDSSSNTWRHNIVGQGGFNWLSMAGFSVGLVTAIARFRRPAYVFLLVNLLVMWLPALLSSGISTLRLSGMLPGYYLLVAVGWLTLTQWAANRLPVAAARLNLALAVLIFVAGGGGAAYSYFIRWANEPEVYRDYQDRYTDLGRYLTVETHRCDILLPFELYTNPTLRFMLYGEFTEVTEPPPARTGRPLLLVELLDAEASTLVWLSRAESGRGLAYVTRSLPPAARKDLMPGGDPTTLHSPATGDSIVRLTPFQSIEPLRVWLTDWAAVNHVDFDWDHEVRLFGYDLWPSLAPQGASPELNLYWQSLAGQPHPRTQFIQLIDRRGRPVGQWTDSALTDQHRWRPGGVIPDRHILWLDPEAAPGPYLVRLGLFDYSTGRRVPIYTAEGESAGDQVVLGLFYVVKGRRDPRLPQVPVRAELGGRIELLGYSYTPLQPGASALKIQLHWQSRRRLAQNYTMFVQLLDRQGQRVTGWDSQPLNGQYPTSAWQPGEVVVDDIELPIPAGLAPGDYRLVTGMYDLDTGQRLPATGGDVRPLPGNMIVLTQVFMP